MLPQAYIFIKRGSERDDGQLIDGADDDQVKSGIIYDSTADSSISKCASYI